MSRLPLRDTKALVLDTSSLAEATVTVGTRSIRIFGVHPNAPAFDFDRWQHYAGDTTHLVRRVHGAVIVAGDFNVTQFNKWIGDLEGLGLRSAHEELGHGTDTTWPNGLRPFPPIRLDHVPVSNAVVPLQIREGAGDGSDHKPVIVDLAVKR